MKIGIYVNKNRDIKCRSSKKLIDMLLAKGMTIFVASGVEEFITLPSYTLEEVAKQAEVLIVFGGDGTMLSVARDAVQHNVALLGVNMGRLGFLTECDDGDLEKLVNRLINHDFHIEERMMLKVTYDNKSYLALNEVALSRSLTKHTIDVSIYVDNRLADIVTGDGVIISTPTGSTAYSLSCGGAILSPSVKAIGVTAICPHSFNSRPMVVSDESTVTLVAKTAFDCKDAVICVDGMNISVVDKNIVINVKKSDYVAKFIRLKDSNFYNKLIQKMSGWNKLDKRRELWQEAKDN